MKNIKNLIIVITLANICFPVFVYAKQLVSASPENSLVVVTSSTPFGKRAGNGFVIGDGTLVITAHHLVFEGSEQGQNEMAGLVTLFSPYLGEGCDAEIIAADEHLDLAILKVAWPGHPALKLADDKSITSAEHMEIIGTPAIIRRMAPGDNPLLPVNLDVKHEKLGVDFVAINRHIPRFISLSGTGKLGDGWSGSPMLLPKTLTVAGCFTRLHGTKGQKPKTSQGPAISQVRNLLDKTGQLKSLHSTKSVIPKPKDGIEVCLLFLRAYRYFTAHKYELAYKETQTLIKLRPESAFAYTLAANTAEKQSKYDRPGEYSLDKYDEARTYYQKALKLNPEGTALKILFAQHLSEHEPDKALEMLDDLWKCERTKPTVALLMFNILSERSDFQRCSDLLNEAIKVNDRNAYLWTNLGACQFQLGKTNDAIDCVTKAVELLPEDGRLRGGLARMLETVGKLDEAEKHFRELLKIEPDNPVVHFWLAKFLAKYRPSANKEALKEAQAALELPAKGRLSKQAIEQFIHDLLSKTDQKPTK